MKKVSRGFKRLKILAVGLQKKWEVLHSIYLHVGKPRLKHKTHDNKELNCKIQEKKWGQSTRPLGQH